MRWVRPLAVFTIVIVALLALAGRPGHEPVYGARPYEGTTIRALVNAEYVKYSLSLVEKDLYDKLGITLETEVIPLDALVAKTMLELNSGESPWHLIMLGASNKPDDGRQLGPPEPSIEKP